jgi:asparagine synthase (glutamine-hydrolysing)
LEFGRCTAAVASVYAGFNNFRARDIFNAWGLPTLREKAGKGALLEVLWAPLALAMTGGVPLHHSGRRLLSTLLRSSHERPWQGLFSSDELNQGTLDDIGYHDQLNEIQTAQKPVTERSATVKALKSFSEDYFSSIYSISAKHGISTRFPFMDRKLIEFCLAVPLEHKLRDGWTRAFLRHGMGDVYPPEIAWQRRKSNLSGGLHDTFRERCLPDIERKLGVGGDPIWQFFDPRGIGELINKAKMGSKSSLYKVWVVWAVSRTLSLTPESNYGEMDTARLYSPTPL